LKRRVCQHARCIEFRLGIFPAEVNLRFLAWLNSQSCPQCAAERVQAGLLESGLSYHSFLKVCEDVLFDGHRCKQ
jgi:hypothetical protein